jgi:ATP-dependent Zn protease
LKNNDDDRRLTAYHEAGHAVARLVSGNPVTAVTLAEDAEADGHTLIFIAHRSPSRTQSAA